MTNYIVTVYRRDPVSDEIAGVVEIPEHDRRATFLGFGQLEKILLEHAANTPPPLKNSRQR